MGIALEPFGDAAVRIRLSHEVDTASLRDALKALPRVIDAVVTERYALVTFDPESPPDGLDAAIDGSLRPPRRDDSPRTPPRLRPPNTHVVQVRYDGPDLQDVARAVGMTTAEVTARHSQRDYVVTAVGFLPGFAYLRGLD
ncbi:MAG TPA: carboxyltransferase domain-containing protein, partial [Polyangiaceae bacterium]|nr:carboxyltransferase domain-containing protein [Polyangiaceae bacterium]